MTHGTLYGLHHWLSFLHIAGINGRSQRHIARLQGIKQLAKQRLFTGSHTSRADQRIGHGTLLGINRLVFKRIGHDCVRARSIAAQWMIAEQESPSACRGVDDTRKTDCHVFSTCRRIPNYWVLSKHRYPSMINNLFCSGSLMHDGW